MVVRLLPLVCLVVTGCATRTTLDTSPPEIQTKAQTYLGCTHASVTKYIHNTIDPSESLARAAVAECYPQLQAVKAATLEANQGVYIGDALTDVYVRSLRDRAVSEASAYLMKVRPGSPPNVH